MFHSQGKSVLYIIGKRSLYGTCSVGIGYLLLKEQNFHCAITPADHRRKVYGAECLRVLFYLFFFWLLGSNPLKLFSYNFHSYTSKTSNSKLNQSKKRKSYLCHSFVKLHLYNMSSLATDLYLKC